MCNEAENAFIISSRVVGNIINYIILDFRVDSSQVNTHTHIAQSVVVWIPANGSWPTYHCNVTRKWAFECRLTIWTSQNSKQMNCGTRATTRLSHDKPQLKLQPEKNAHKTDFCVATNGVGCSGRNEIEKCEILILEWRAYRRSVIQLRPIHNWRQNQNFVETTICDRSHSLSIESGH